LTTSSNVEVRRIMMEKMKLTDLVTFDKFVFKDAVIGSTIFLLDKESKHTKTKVKKLFSTGELELIKELDFGKSNDWNVLGNIEYETLMNKIESGCVLLKDLVAMSKGMVVQDRKDFIHFERQQDDLPFILGSSITRYFYEYKHYAKYSELKIIGGTRDFVKQTSIPRLLIRRTGNVLCVVYSEQKELIESTLYILTSERINLKFLIGILNSKLMSFYLQQKLITNAQGFPQILMWQLDQLPIRLLNLDYDREQQSHNQFKANVNQLIESQKQLQIAKTESEKEYLEKKCSIIDKQIDALVYELYGLTEEEIKIVEGN